MQGNIFTEIKSEYEFLSRVEKKIADLLLENPQEFITYSTAQLSELCGVSQGSINNFSKKFCSGGYSDLKLKVASGLSLRNQKPFAVVDKSQSIKQAMELKIKETLISFQNTLDINSEAELNAAVEKILNAKRIEIYGVYYSGLAARDFCYQLIQLGVAANFVSDTLMCAVSASMLNSNSLVIAISSSGKTKEIIDTVDIAKENNVPVICLTSDKFSPLAKKADNILLTTSSGMSVSDKENEIRLAQLLVIDTVCSYLRSIIDLNSEDRYYKTTKILNSHSIKD